MRPKYDSVFANDYENFIDYIDDNLENGFVDDNSLYKKKNVNVNTKQRKIDGHWKFKLED